MSAAQPLAVDNGVLDLRSGKLYPHDRWRLMTKLVPARFDPEARCDRWERFLSRVMGGNAELIAFLQRAVGYSLTGVTGERCLFFLYGMGANGKSTFLEVMRALLAGYAQQADFTSFLERQGEGPRNDIARLFGARVVTSSEVGENLWRVDLDRGISSQDGMPLSGGLLAICDTEREAGRMAATAKTHLELAVMCAVKAVSRYTEPKKHTCEHSGAKVDITSVQVEQVTDEVLLRNQARADS